MFETKVNKAEIEVDGCFAVAYIFCDDLGNLVIQIQGNDEVNCGQTLVPLAQLTEILPDT